VRLGKTHLLLWGKSIEVRPELIADPTEVGEPLFVRQLIV